MRSSTVLVQSRVAKIGDRFGKLTVIGQPFRARWGYAKCFTVCQCDCGKQMVANLETLRRGETQSCGCLVGTTRDYEIKHGHARMNQQSPTYRSWYGMIRRCENAKHPDYQHYGAVGIRVCDRWRNSFTAFLEDMGPRPSPQHSLDRFPNQDGDYEPGNCRWATSSEQNRNKRTSHLLTVDGETKTLAEWSEISGVPRTTIARRYRDGMTSRATLFALKGQIPRKQRKDYGVSRPRS